MIIGTAGHIDHGKTALVKALTGVDADRLPEEKRRGITIDLGFAPLSLDGLGTIGVIDVPGHEDFVRSMVVGASGVDLGLLVVAADEGVMPQTREHLSILLLLGIRRIVVALTKSDLADAEWSSLVMADIQSLFQEMGADQPQIVSCSSKTSEGLDELRTALSAALSAVRPRTDDDLFRMPVDRAFTVKGTGTVVTGTVWSGDVGVDEGVRILPAERNARVRRLEQHGHSVGRASGGNRAAVALSGVEIRDASRGSVIVRDASWRATSLFEAVVALDPEAANILTARTRLRLHAGASETGARITLAERASDPPLASPLSPLANVGRVLARIATDAPIVLRAGDRFVLRLPAPLRTVGGGVVVDPYARRRTLPHVSRERSEQLALSLGERLRFVLEAEQGRGIRLSDLPVRIGCAPAEVPELIELTGGYVGKHNLFSPADVEQVMASVRRIVAEYEIKSPLALGVPAQTVRESVRVSEELADISIKEMERSGEIDARGPLLRRRGWVPSPTDRDVEESNHLAHDICAAQREPPSVGELVARYGNSVPALLRFLERQGRIVQVEEDRYYDRSAVEQMIDRLQNKLVPGQVYVPAQLRDVLGFSRKYLIPFLEFCDRSGVTERRGEGRVLRGNTRTLLDRSPTHS